MGVLLFFRRSCAYRHAARTELSEARSLPRGSERDRALKRARALFDLARDQAWLEGQARTHRNDRRFGTASVAPERIAVHSDCDENRVRPSSDRRP